MNYLYNLSGLIYRYADSSAKTSDGAEGEKNAGEFQLGPLDLEILKKRLAGDQTRPLADKLESLLETRRPLYAQADIRLSIEQEQTPQAITAQIIETIPSVIKSPV